MKDWTEDFAYENGYYENKCRNCGETFMGNKHRIICRECADTKQVSVEPEVKPVNGGIVWQVMKRMLGMSTVQIVSTLNNKTKAQELLKELTNQKFDGYEYWILESRLSV